MTTVRSFTVRLLLGLTVLVASTGSAAPAQAAPDGLRTFRSCGQLVKYGRAAAAKPMVPTRLGTYGFAGTFQPRTPLRKRSKYSVVAEAGEVVEGVATSGDPSPFSSTNNQESSVDEPDAVKTDGRRLFVAAGRVLRVYDVAADTPTLLGTLELGPLSGELLLQGDKLIVLSRSGRNADSTRILEVDVANPAAMRVLRTLVVQGTGVTARLTGSTVRVVLNTSSELPYAVYERRTRAAARARRTLEVSSFVPDLRVTEQATGRRSVRRLIDCDELRRPHEDAGLDLLSVLTFDLGQGLAAVQTEAIMGAAQTVYASEQALYVATTAYAATQDPDDVDGHETTEIHRFDTSVAGRTTYVASGSVPGYALNQYAMSEWAGDLRIATTESPTWIEGAERERSASRITVLRPTGAELRTVGHVDGLGKGERIYAARFAGPVGYLVTFRQVDPLYTLDLADPAAPRVVGELKIKGYSAYLHPIGDGLLLGVGQDADARGTTTGTQISLFDVSNPAAPVRLSQQRLGNGGTEVEYDPHSFLWWAPLGLAVLPVWSTDETGTYYDAYRSAAIVQASRGAGLAALGAVTHGPLWDQAAVQRSVVVGDRLLTISAFGIATSRLPAGAPYAYATFPPDPDPYDGDPYRGDAD